MNLEGTHIRSIDISGYRHSYEDFCEKFTYPMFINKGKTTRAQGAYAIELKNIQEHSREH